MGGNENKADITDSIKEKLRDAVSLLIMLENDLSAEHSDEVHLRAVKVIHKMLKEALSDLSG